jgi:sterol 3beta-glucosyltransferase
LKIGVITWGTEGDVRPFFSLAQALGERGHEVRVAYTNVEGRDHGALARSCGLDARPVATDYFREHAGELAERTRACFDTRTVLTQLSMFVEHQLDPVIEPLTDAALELAESSDLLVAHFLVHPAFAAALRHRRPIVSVALQPVVPTRFVPPIGAPALGTLPNRLAWRAYRLVVERMLLGRINATRARLGVARARDVVESLFFDVQGALVGLSPALFARPADWPAHVELPGFFGVDAGSEAWAPGPELEAFFASGPAPVYLSCGSMFHLDLARAAEAVGVFVEALALVGARGIIQAPAEVSARLRSRAAPSRVAFLEQAPHAHLFPRCAAIVHHGGSGTTQAALLAGKPSIVVPHLTDQFMFGALLHGRGLGAAPLPRRRLSSRALAARLRHVLADAHMPRRAAEVGARMRAERGAARAADFITRVAGR